MKTVLVVGAGPSGLMAAEVLARAGVSVHLFDAMPSVGRKFLLAGRGGLNLTHSEPLTPFISRFGARSAEVGHWLQSLGPAQVRDWAHGLGVETFVGSSGRVFPTDMKAAPLLRAWLHRMRQHGPGVSFHMRHRWLGWTGESPHDALRLRFLAPQGSVDVQGDAVLLALGGASWARLGSDGAWWPWLAARGVPLAPLLPANCGFDIRDGWSEHFSSRFAGQPFKSVALATTLPDGSVWRRRGEFVATVTGVEGSLIYAASSHLRDQLMASGRATCLLDLLPDFSPERVLAEVSHPRGARSLSSHLRSRLGLEGIKMALLHEVLPREILQDPVQLALAIKALPLDLARPRPIDEAISTAGGVCLQGLNTGLMVRNLPGVFCAGEMLDWEAPTGGYLLTACLASGRAAALGILDFLHQTSPG
jgi:uncharacterized flavoprotein (TIGR03862 family)